MAEERGGFLGRWARRKTDILQGKPLPEPAPDEVPAPVAKAGDQSPSLPPETSPTEPAARATISSPGEAPKALTLDDVKRLTRDSDFKPFMAGGVGREVRNAAMKKLFADPHFNVMDGLDIYIDDYSKSDPIPESMLRQMASAKFLKLFDDEEEPGPGDGASLAEAEAEAEGPADPMPAPRENANNPMDETVAQSEQTPAIAGPGKNLSVLSSQSGSAPELAASHQDHAHTDLRLQPDDATPAPGAGRGTS